MSYSGYNRSAEVVFAQSPDRGNARACVDKCVKRLKPQERTLILEIFGDKKKDLIELAADMRVRGVSMTRLKMIRRRLKNCIEKCLSEIELDTI